MTQDYTVLNYGPPSPHEYLNPQVRTMVSQPGMKPEQNLFLTRNSKEKTGKEPLPDVLIMDNLGKLLATTVDKAHGNTSESIVERFIKPRASKIF